MGSGRDDRGGDGAGAGTGAGAGDVTTGDRLAAAVDELYGAAPEAFTGRRGELAAAARDAGDRAAAKGISALRKPTRAAWVVNRLARADPGAPGKLAELAAALRAAQQAGHGLRLRELSAARGSLVDALTAQALAVAEVADPPPSLRLEVTQTLTAAIADPEVAADFAAGTLTHAVQWSGFGVLPADRGDGGDRDLAERDAAGTTTLTGSVASGTGRSGSGARAARPAPRTAAAPAAPPADAARRQAELNERLAREAAERAARRQEQYEEAERLVAASAATAATATSAEDRLEAEVRDLEQRLTQARADLAAARMRARHAEAAERRARQARDRLPREPGG